MGVNIFFKEFIMSLINKKILTEMCKDRNMQWSVGSYLLSMAIFSMTVDKFSDAVFYSQVIFVLVALYRAYLLYKGKKNAKS